MSDWKDGYRAAVAGFLGEKGRFVDLRHYPKPGWLGQDDDPDDYDDMSVTYGWRDYDHLDVRYEGCPIKVVHVDTVREQSLSLFENTFTSNKMEAGVEVRASCACGKYDRKWLRWEGSVGEILPRLLEG